MKADADIAQALGLVETAAFNEAELDAYLDRARIETSLLGDAKAEGKAEGLTQAIQAMHVSGMSAEQISQILNLALIEVQRSLNA